MRICRVLFVAARWPIVLGLASGGAVAVTPLESVREEITIQERDNIILPLSKVRIESPALQNSGRSVCPGDFNGNGRVDFQDFLAFADVFGATSGETNYNRLMDLNDNGSVDFPDFLVLADLFGTTCPESPSVSIPDTSLRAVIADNLGKANDAPITRADMETLTWLAARDRNVRDLTGIEFAINLEALDLRGNELTGAIPPALGNLTNLVNLDLTDNELTGAIPHWLDNLNNLEMLFLGGNQLAGAIPRELGSLTKLKRLWLQRNELTGGIPPWLSNLTNLEVLSLGGNQLTGPIPRELDRLPNLEWLFLYGNPLSGQIPHWLGSMTNLKRLWLSGNQLTGGIPPWLGNLANLERLGLSGNQLTGPIPPALGRLGKLEHLDLSRNQLTGAIPRELGRLTNLELLDLYGNTGLSGPLPRSFTDLVHLLQLGIGETELCAPSTSAFQAWLRGLESWRRGVYPTCTNQ